MNPFRSQRDEKAQRAPILAAVPAPSGEGTVSLRLYDPIDSWGGYWGISAKEFVAALDSVPDDTTEIRVLINSPGGDVFEGIAILNALRNHPARVVAVVEGIAASSASFIAAGADEVVMMKNSELFVHNAWTIAMGDADDLTHTARDLSHIDRNIASVYAEKSGESVDHWLTIMATDLFLSAEEAVEAGLADRIEGVGDAASAKARFDLSVFAKRERPAARAEITRPGSTEPDEPNRKDVTMSDTFKAEVSKRLGISEADVTDETALAALDQVLAEQADPTEPAPVVAKAPEGTVIVDEQQFADLKSQAALGVTAHAQLAKNRREGIVDAAIKDGRVKAGTRDEWLARLERDEEGFAAALDSLEKNTIPVDEIGISDSVRTAEDAAYERVYGSQKGA